jgi:hypothetical protein
MKIFISVSILLFMLGGSTITLAQSTPQNNAKWTVGAYGGGGLSFVSGNGYETMISLIEQDHQLKFSAAGGAYADYFFNKTFGLEMGAGVVGNGIRFTDGEADYALRIRYLEFPVLVKARISYFRLAVGLAVWVGVSGESEYYEGSRDITKWNDDDWQNFHRVNVGPLVMAGMAIPAGPLSVVPSVTFRAHLINDINSDALMDDDEFIGMHPTVNEDELKMRFFSVHLNCAVEYSF